jgi:hypothetical protein
MEDMMSISVMAKVDVNGQTLSAAFQVSEHFLNSVAIPRDQMLRRYLRQVADSAAALMAGYRKNA